MIALFATGDFVRVSIKEDFYGLGREGLLVGYAIFSSPEEGGTHNLYGIVIGEEGDSGFVSATDMVVAFVYDAEKDTFVDRTAAEPDDTFEEEQPLLE